MRRIILVSVFMIISSCFVIAQELRCNVQVVTNQIQGTNK